MLMLMTPMMKMRVRAQQHSVFSSKSSRSADDTETSWEIHHESHESLWRGLPIPSEPTRNNLRQNNPQPPLEVPNQIGKRNSQIHDRERKFKVEKKRKGLGLGLGLGFQSNLPGFAAGMGKK